MPRCSSQALRVLLPSLLVLALFGSLAGCTSGDPTTAVQAGAQGTYLHATITLLDVNPVCRPGIACTPEFYDCDGAQGFTVPKTWTVDATEALAGGAPYFAYDPTPPPVNARGVIVVRGTDTARNTAISMAFAVQVDAATGTVTSSLDTSELTFANVDARCTRLNPSLDPVTLFGIVPAQPSSFSLQSIGSTSTDIVFAQRAGAGLTPDHAQGTFSFIAENRQEFGQVYVARIQVDGCFRVQIPLVEQAVALDPSASAPCP